MVRDVTYDGPIVVSGIDVPSFDASAFGLGGSEEAIINETLNILNKRAAGTGVSFTTERPQNDQPYSTIYVGGNDSAFTDQGSFLGLAESIDVLNTNLDDEAFVFSELFAFSNYIHTVETAAVDLSAVIAHESAHLLGWSHFRDDPAFSGSELFSVGLPYFTSAKLEGNNPGSNFQASLGQNLDFSGSARDSAGLSKITIKVNSPKVTNYTVATYNVSGTYRSLSSYDFNTANTTYAGVPGSYTVALWAKDIHGDATSQTWNFTVTDTSDPVFSNPKLEGYTSGSNFQASLGQNLDFSGTVTDNVGLSQITIKVNSPKVTNYTVATYNVSGTSRSLSSYDFNTANATYAGVPGSYTVALWAKDTSGRTASRTWNFTIADTTDPVFSNPKLEGYTSGSNFQASLGQNLDFSGTVTDNVGLSQITIKVNSPKVTNYTVATYNVSGTSRSLSSYDFNTANATYAGVPGSYTVALWAKDTSGRAASRTWNFTIADTTDPVFSNPKLEGYTSGSNFQASLGQNLDFSGTVTDNVGLSQITIKVNSPKVTNYTVATYNVSGTSRSLSSYDFNTANTTYAGVPGSYTVALWAKDTSGRTASRTWNFTIADTTDPVFSNPKLEGYTSGSNFQASLGQNLDFSGTVTDNVGLSQITIKVNSPKVTNYTVATYNVSGTSRSLSSYDFNTANTTYAGVPGSYTVALWAKDTSGRTASTTWNFTIADTQSPTFSNPLLGGNSPASSFQVNQGQVLSFSGTANDNVALSVITVRISNSKVTDHTVTTGPVTGTSKSLSGYSIDTGNATYASVPGSYTVSIFAKDAANNPVTSETWDFTVLAPSDTQSPTFSNPLLGGNSPASSFQVNQGQVLSFSGTANDNVALSVITVRISNSKVTDHTVTTGPVTGTSKSLSGYSIDTGNATYANVPGSYTVSIFAKDAANNPVTSETWGFTVLAPSDTQSPTFSNPLLGGNSPASSFQVNQGQVLSFSGTANDNVALSVITVRISNSKVTDHTVTTGPVTGTSKSLSGYSIDTGNATYANVPGSYTVSIFAKDAANNPVTSETWDFTVLAPSDTQSPTFSNPLLGGNSPVSSFQVNQGQVLSFSGTANDNVALSVITVRISNSKVTDHTVTTGPVTGTSKSLSGYSIDTGNATYANVPGSYTVSIFAKDAANNPVTSETWDFTVTPVGDVSDLFDYPIGNRGYSFAGQPEPLLEFADGSPFRRRTISTPTTQLPILIVV